MPLIPDQGIDHAGGPYVPKGIPSVFADAGYCGRSFNEGVLRFHDAVSGPEFRAYVRAAFPEIVDPAMDVLAFDWQGRQIITLREKRSLGRWGEAELHVADLAAGQILELATIPEFAAVLKQDLTDQVFNKAQYDAFREAFSAPGGVLAFTECVEYSHPLFLGGQDHVSNMAVIDAAVYWSVTGQLRASTAALPPGTQISGFTTT
jgi:hypothetical protein